MSVLELYPVLIMSQYRSAFDIGIVMVNKV